jgi:hypothetical protein
MKTFTLEWNAVITLESEGRKGCTELRELISLHGDKISLGIVSTAASENNLGRELPKTAVEFEKRLKEVGIDHLPKVLTVAVWGLTYYEYSLWAGDEYASVTNKLWGIVKPVWVSSNSAEFAEKFNIPVHTPITSPEYFKWRNKWCDVNSLYAHILAKRDVFVSGDVKNFRGEKHDKLMELGVGQICSYEEALTLAQSL